MPSPLIRQITQEVREDNPKAVFYGDFPEVVNPLALYLTQSNVDLYAGNSFHDASFGEYFFYAGTFDGVKAFLAEKNTELPKTLLLLTDVSDKSEVEQYLKNYPTVKAVLLLGEPFLTDEEPARIIEFFFGSGKQVMLRKGERGVVKKVLPTPDPVEATQTVEESAGGMFATQVVEEQVSQAATSNVPEPEVVENEVSEPQNTPIEPPQEPIKSPEAPVAPTPVIEEKGFDNLAPVAKPQEVEKPRLTKSWPKDEEPVIDTPAMVKKPLPETPLISANYPASIKTPTNVDQKIENLYRTTEPKPTGNVGVTHSRMSVLLAGVIGFVIFLTFPFISLGVEFSMAGLKLAHAKGQLEKLETDPARKSFENARWWSGLAQKNVELVSPILSLIQKQSLSKQLAQLGQLFDSVASAGKEMSEGTSQLVILMRGITGEEKGVAYATQIASAKNSFQLANQNLGEAQAVLKSESLKPILSQPLIQNSFKSIGALDERFTSVRKSLQSTIAFLSLAPDLIGLNGERTYLVLFQNNMELRPTGGFIGSYGLLKFADGKFKDMKIEDVYVADGALQGHVDPPPAIASYLGQEHWYLRDSNWSVSFAESAQRALWFIDKEQQVRANGVIAVDVSFVQKLLSVTGPLKVPDLTEPVSADTLFTKAHAQINTDFFPGSTVKRDYLGAVGRALLDQLFTQKLSVSPKLLAALSQSFEEKHALVYFSDSNSQSIVSSLAWGGEVRRVTCVTLSCTEGVEGDFISVVDANLGVNKSNFFIERAISAQVSLSEQTISHTLQVQYKNNSPLDDNKVGGEYKNYVRVLLPPSSQVTQMKLDELPLTLSSAPVASAATFIATPEQGLLAVSALVDVPAQRERTLSVSYTTRVNIPGTYEYQLTFQKQPGTLSDSLALTLNYPGNWTALVGNTNVAGVSTLVKEQQITYNTDLLTDRFFKVPFK